MMLRLTLLQIKIIRKLFTLSSRRAKDDQTPNFREFHRSPELTENSGYVER